MATSFRQLNLRQQSFQNNLMVLRVFQSLKISDTTTREMNRLQVRLPRPKQIQTSLSPRLHLPKTTMNLHRPQSLPITRVVQRLRTRDIPLLFTAPSKAFRAPTLQTTTRTPPRPCATNLDHNPKQHNHFPYIMDFPNRFPK